MCYNPYVSSEEVAILHSIKLANELIRTTMENLQTKDYKEPILIKDLGNIFLKETHKKKYRCGLYLCYCGNEFKAFHFSINSKSVKSCGCYNKTCHTTHGNSYKKLYSTWNKIISRCINKKDKSYIYYGGRGIKICDEWLIFENFEKWCLNNGYNKGLSIDRINNDGNYNPSNCRWVTHQIQMRNTRRLQKNNTSGYRGVSFEKSASRFIARIMIDKKSKKLKTSKCRLECAYAYDKYVLDNNLEHTRNFS